MSATVQVCSLTTAGTDAACSEMSVPALFARQVRIHADDVAIVGQESTLTYAELNRFSNRIAHSIPGAGCGTQARVGLLLKPGPSAIAAMLGALKAGASLRAARSLLPGGQDRVHAPRRRPDAPGNG
nr:hypothetical protein Hi04_10k_c1889_00017 [uncultured bacterium]